MFDNDFLLSLLYSLNLIIRTKNKLNLLIISKFITLRYFFVFLTNKKIIDILWILSNPLVILNVFIGNVFAIILLMAKIRICLVRTIRL